MKRDAVGVIEVLCHRFAFQRPRSATIVFAVAAVGSSRTPFGSVVLFLETADEARSGAFLTLDDLCDALAAELRRRNQGRR